MGMQLKPHRGNVCESLLCKYCTHHPVLWCIYQGGTSVSVQGKGSLPTAACRPVPAVWATCRVDATEGGSIHLTTTTQHQFCTAHL